MTTLRQVLANRRNARRSTGPKTPGGKAVSRRNALKHGLAGEGVVLPDEEQAAADERFAQWESSLRPFDVYEVWLVQRMATEAVRVERCARHDASLRALRAHRAADCWDEDRRAAVEALAADLPRRPGAVASTLRQTAHGCAWLIGRWEALGKVLEAAGAWDDAHRALALDLLGVPPELRDGPGPLDAPPGADPGEHLARIARGEAARLAALKESALDDLDASEQDAAIHGLESETPVEIRRLRRYESSCLRRLEWAFHRLRSRTRDPLPPDPGPGTGPGAGPGRRDESAPDDPARAAWDAKFRAAFPNACVPHPDPPPPPLGLFPPPGPLSGARIGPAPNRRARRAALRRARRA